MREIHEPPTANPDAVHDHAITFTDMMDLYAPTETPMIHDNQVQDKQQHNNLKLRNLPQELMEELGFQFAESSGPTDSKYLEHPKFGKAEFKEQPDGYRKAEFKQADKTLLTVTVKPNGSITIDYGNDKVVHLTRLSDGSLEVSGLPLGHEGTTVFRADGTRLEKPTDGRSPYVVKELPDGSEERTYEEGTKETRMRDGRILIVYANGVKEEIRRDSTVIITYPEPDGTIIRRTPDGRIITKHKDGTVITEATDGTIVTKEPDGTIITRLLPKVGCPTLDVKRPDGTRTRVPMVDTGRGVPCQQ